MYHNIPGAPTTTAGLAPASSKMTNTSSNPNINSSLQQTSKAMYQQQQQQQTSNGGINNNNNNEELGGKRLSGGKRDAEQSAATDSAVVSKNNNNNNQQMSSSSNNMQQQQQMQQQQSNSNNNMNNNNNTDAANNNNGQPVKKQKITYALPHQNMEEGHFYVVLGEDIDVSTGRFKILSLLGEGTFGKVVEAWDRKRKEYCAVKIVRNIPKYTRDAEYEIRFMERIRSADPNDNFAVMKILRHFRNDPQHVCIVMPKFGPCLLDHLQKHGPFSHRHLAEITFHMACALDFLHSTLRLMHTDLKPENCLLESSKLVPDPVTGRAVPQLPCRVRICDLGGCCDENHSRSAIVSTRHYRSPEVILGLGWMFSTDMWSMGCIVYELATGRLLYDTHENLEHLHLMEKTLGRLPTDWAPRVREDCRNLFSANGTLRSLTEAKSISRVSRARPVRETIQDELLRDLILNSLTYDRSKRLSARAMSTHPYILKYFPESLACANHPKNRANLDPVPSL